MLENYDTLQTIQIICTCLIGFSVPIIGTLMIIADILEKKQNKKG